MELSVPQGVTQWVVYESTSPEQLLTHLAGADIAITNKVKIRREHLEQLPQLKFIQLTATGMDNIDTEAAKELGVTVRNVVGYSTESVAEHFFMLMLASLRGLKPYHTAVETGVWQADGRFCLTEPTLLDLHTRTLGIIGVGNIGKAITERAKAFGMRVLWAEREGKAPRNSDYTPFDQVLAQSDVLSLNCPLTPETRHLICERTLAKMQRKPLLINVARGAVVDPQAVYDALQQDKILGFATDVFEQEPPRKDDPLMQLAQHPRVLLTPHVAWASQYALDKLWKKVKEQIEQFIQWKTKNKI